MYNDKNRQNTTSRYAGRPTRTPIGRSCPTFAEAAGEEKRDVPRVDQRIGNRLCDGTLPGNDTPDIMGDCIDGDMGWGLHNHPLAMVYSPLQDFREIYDTDKALERGTLFAELDLPFEGGRGKKGAGLC